MVRIFLLTLLIAFSALAGEPRKKVVIIDSGIKANYLKKYLCKEGHKDFSGANTLEDSKSASFHGTNIVSLISPGMDPSKECLVILKFWRAENTGMENIRAANKALKHALTLDDVILINYSGGGSPAVPEETRFIKALLKKGVKIAVAAGNESQDLDAKCNYYPACLKKQLNTENLQVVGNLNNTTSNYGSVVDQWVDGTGKGFNKLTGTSQSTAIFSSRWLRRLREGR